ncbi:DNA polymerase III subunit delta [Methylocella sp.]|uniref:DNA polymerase III subunit delta n=1 Tax=Methylocella sp. TaxID=1978226 RepID=UPI003C27C8AA
MVAVKNSEADKFLGCPAPHIYLYLVFGPDLGLVAERARAIVRNAVDDPKDPFQLLRVSGDDLSADPLRLADEANTIGLFGGRRAIWIESQGKAFISALESVVAAPPRDCTIVIEAGALKRDAPLRRLCEREKNAAAIECYPDSPKDVEHLIDAEAAGANIGVAPEARALLVSLLGQDRLATRAELSKLFLYAYGAAEINVDHIEAIVSDASSLMLDHAVDGAFDGDFGALEAGARRALTQGGDAGLLLGAALRHALGLRRARLDLDAGAPARAPFGGGPRRAQIFDAHLSTWTAARLARAVEILAEAINKLRREPKLAEAIALRALWRIAGSARPKPPRR